MEPKTWAVEYARSFMDMCRTVNGWPWPFRMLLVFALFFVLMFAAGLS